MCSVLQTGVTLFVKLALQTCRVSRILSKWKQGVECLMVTLCSETYTVNKKCSSEQQFHKSDVIIFVKPGACGPAARVHLVSLNYFGSHVGTSVHVCVHPQGH